MFRVRGWGARTVSGASFTFLNTMYQIKKCCDFRTTLINKDLTSLLFLFIVRHGASYIAYVIKLLITNFDEMCV